MELFDPLQDIQQYSPTLKITQVLAFCERKGLNITRPMVQNYIRDGVMPPPKGRVYTNKHLAALALISRLKTVYDIPTIKAVLAPYMDAEGLPLDKYAEIMQNVHAAQKQWDAKVAPVFDKGMGTCAAMLHTAYLREGLLN